MRGVVEAWLIELVLRVGQGVVESRSGWSLCVQDVFFGAKGCIADVLLLSDLLLEVQWALFTKRVQLHGAWRHGRVFTLHVHVESVVWIRCNHFSSQVLNLRKRVELATIEPLHAKLHRITISEHF